MDGGQAVRDVVVIGAGPAGLTAAYVLGKRGGQCTVLETDDVVGGISRTVERDGWRFDIGGHRFFTKVPAVEALWHEILPEGDFLLRPRASRIYYRGKFFDYPIRPLNALGNLGPIEAVRCVFSYLWVKVRPPEGHLVARDLRRLQVRVAPLRPLLQDLQREGLGRAGHGDLRRLGRPAHQGHVALGRRVGAAAGPLRRRPEGPQPGHQPHRPVPVPEARARDDVGAVPRAGRGPGIDRRRSTGGSSASSTATTGPPSVLAADSSGTVHRYPADHVISSMPLPVLVKVMDPPPPPEVLAAADALGFRDFLQHRPRGPGREGHVDRQLDLHPRARASRPCGCRTSASWSPFMVRDGRNVLGLEYTVMEGDEWWSAPDDELVARGIRELEASSASWTPPTSRPATSSGCRRRTPSTTTTYQANVEVLRTWLEQAVPNVHPVGRNGMHKYNNQDHSMFTAMLTVDNIYGADHDIWAVNVEEEYHEESRPGEGTPT